MGCPLMMKSLSWSHPGILSFVPIIGQYGSASFLLCSIGESLEPGDVEAGESIASLTMLTASMCRDSRVGVEVRAVMAL